MSNYYDPSHGNNSHDGLDGSLDPANAFRGNSSPAAIGGIEIAIIVGTVVAFFSIVGAIFFYRQREARLTALARDENSGQQHPPVDLEAGKQVEDVSALSDGVAARPVRSWTRFLPGRQRNEAAKRELDERGHEMTRFN